MRTNLEHSRLHEPRIGGLRLTNIVAVLAGTQVIPDESPSVWILDGGASNRTVRLPSLVRDKQIVIGNVGATNDLNITDSVGNALVTLPANAIVEFFAGTTRWIWSTANFLNLVTTTVVTASGNVAASDVEVQVNGAGVVVLTLPLSAVWAAGAGRYGLPLSIQDISGNASANNITINPSGGQTISGLASLTIDSNYFGFYLRPKDGGGWVFR